MFDRRCHLNLPHSAESQFDDVFDLCVLCLCVPKTNDTCHSCLYFSINMCAFILNTSYAFIVKLALN